MRDKEELREVRSWWVIPPLLGRTETVRLLYHLRDNRAVNVARHRQAKERERGRGRVVDGYCPLEA
jgi:hypothetical protein